MINQAVQKKEFVDIKPNINGNIPNIVNNENKPKLI